MLQASSSNLQILKSSVMEPHPKLSPWRQILTYFYLRRRDPGEPRNLNIKFMHGMNRISLIIFLIAIIIMIVRAIRHA